MKQTFLQPATQESNWSTVKLDVNDSELFYRNLIGWGKGLKTFFAFDSAGYTNNSLNRFEWLIMAEEYRKVTAEEFLIRPIGKLGDWIGFLVSYDFKNLLHHQEIIKNDLLQTDLAYFFEPVWVFYKQNGVLYADYRSEYREDFIRLLRELNNSCPPTLLRSLMPEFKPLTDKTQYLSNFEKLLWHLYRGDIYEVNYCVLYLSDGNFDYHALWSEQLSKSSGPMGGVFKTGDISVISKSPERFLVYRNGRLYSQPIKGTIKRGRDHKEDEQLRAKLNTSKKERSENVMIVDLVRNDLSRICEIGSVKVDELFGIYTFPMVHQMVSTVSGVPRDNLHLHDVMKALFPMGSMTGAPKISAMKIIQSVETHNRGYYSGSAGYIAPDGEMDSNVIIRSIVSDQASGKAYIGVGSAVTIYTNGEDEYNECLLKLNSVLS
ncbi:anthranilate synthase component I family protein [Schleiferia thermophila]